MPTPGVPPGGGGQFVLSRQIGMIAAARGDHWIRLSNEWSVSSKLAQIAPEALQDALRQLERKDAPRIPQDASIAMYAPKLEREHGRIDWNEPAVVIERKIRAYNPWPGAFTVLRDEAGAERKLKIHRASVIADRKNDPEHLVIAAQDGALRLEEVQLEGKNRMSADEFLRGYNAPVRLA